MIPAAAMRARHQLFTPLAWHNGSAATSGVGLASRHATEWQAQQLGQQWKQHGLVLGHEGGQALSQGGAGGNGAGRLICWGADGGGSRAAGRSPGGAADWAGR